MTLQTATVESVPTTEAGYFYWKFTWPEPLPAGQTYANTSVTISAAHSCYLLSWDGSNVNGHPAAASRILLTPPDASRPAELPSTATGSGIITTDDPNAYLLRVQISGTAVPTITRDRDSTKHTAFRNSAWTPFWGWYGAGDELGSYAGGQPSFALVDGLPYISSAYGPSWGFQRGLGRPESAPYVENDFAAGVGYRHELSGIFKIKPDHTLEKVYDFPRDIFTVWGVTAHPNALGPVPGIGFDYDQWVGRGDGVLGAPRNDWSHQLFYQVPRSVQGELIFYEGDGSAYALVQETREVLFAVHRADGSIGLHRFPASTPTPPGGPYDSTLFNVDGNTQKMNGLAYFQNITVDDAGKIWVAFTASRMASNPNEVKLLLASFPNLHDGAVSTVVHSATVNNTAGVAGDQGGALAYMQDRDLIWYVDSFDIPNNINANGLIKKMDKVTGATVTEFDPNPPSLGGTRRQLSPTIIKVNGTLYTDPYYSRIAERQPDGTWIWETETPEFDLSIRTARNGEPKSKLNFDFYRIIAYTDSVVYGFFYDELADPRSGSGAITYGFNPDLKLTKGVLTPSVGTTSGLAGFFGYIGKSAVQKKQRLIGGPYQPPIAASQAGIAGDVSYKRSGAEE